jgi:hypothetical protein
LFRATSFGRLPLSRMVYKNAAHQLGGYSKKLGSVLPFRILLIDQS